MLLLLLLVGGVQVKLQRGETIIMCPYADLINHNPYANTYIEAER